MTVTAHQMSAPIAADDLPVESTRDQKQRRMVLKHNDHFTLLDLSGKMPAQNGAGLGLYHNDTRYLSLYDWTVSDVSDVSDTVDNLTTPQALQFLTADTREGFAAALTYNNSATSRIKAEQLFFERLLVIEDGMLEQLAVTNYSGAPVKIALTLRFGSDYADMFEVRGDKRKARGRLLTPSLKHSENRFIAELSYIGRDNFLRRTHIEIDGPVSSFDNSSATLRLELAPHQRAVVNCRVRTSELDLSAESSVIAPESASLGLYPGISASAVDDPIDDWSGTRFNPYGIDVVAALNRARSSYSKWLDKQARISTGNAQFNEVLEQSYRDLYLLRQTSNGMPAMAAGVPWFAVPFGRDSLVVGLQTLPLMPEMSREIIDVLAHYQGKKHEVETAEMPGRIMHELRPGEMARLGEIAFRPYYGTVDATPLWLWLLAEYVLLTGDTAFARKHWKSVRLALTFLENEVAKSGYLTYGGRGDTALSNQGWKDSGNCIVYANGELARGPIAVCEAQGYLFAAWFKLARVATRLGYKSMGRALTLKAIALKKRFNRQFYMADRSFYAIALDGENKRCEVISSNPGHLIITGILPQKRAKEVALRMLESDMFNGFGVRTLASSEVAYQPMDYQVGAVWPHDNGFLVAGLCRLGMAEGAHKVLRALTDVALSQSDRRLPELFCGFDRTFGSTAPVPYQVACIPQLWAAGSILHMSHALSTMTTAAPDWLGHIEVRGKRYK